MTTTYVNKKNAVITSYVNNKEQITFIIDELICDWILISKSSRSIVISYIN